MFHVVGAVVADSGLAETQMNAGPKILVVVGLVTVLVVIAGLQAVSMWRQRS